MAQEIYRGEAIGGAYQGPIQASVAMASGNDKTGSVLTLWVLPDVPGMSPWEAVKAGHDKATCGDCPLRDGQCYTHPGASQVLSAGASSIRRGMGGRLVVPSKAKRARSAAFGDAASLPLYILEKWRAMRASYGLAPIGYTHAWRTRFDLAQDHMASVETEEGADAADAAGWRYFRVRPVGSPVKKGEIQCPAVATAGRINPIDCNACGLCDGLARNKNGKRLPHVTIENHGAPAKKAATVARRTAALSIGR